MSVDSKNKTDRFKKLAIKLSDDGEDYQGSLERSEK